MVAERWYGVRVFNDVVAADTPVPTDEDLDALIRVEEIAGRTDPYRWFGSQLHVVAARTGALETAGGSEHGAFG